MKNARNAIKVSKQTRNLLAYVIGTIIVILGTILLVALATGWQYDFSTGELHETGLLIMDTEPNNATITINGTPLKQRTPYRYTNVFPGEYDVSFTLTGYRPWVRRTLVEAERVAFNDYAWLLPDTVPARPRFASHPIIHVVQSIDRRREIFVEQPEAPAGGLKPAPRLTVTTDWAREPTTLYAPTVAPLNTTTPDPTQVVSIDSLQLSPDGNNLLARQTLVNGTAQYIILATTPSDNLKVTNLTTEFAKPIEWLEWGPTGNNELWLKSQNSLSRWLVNERRLENSGLDDVTYADWSFEKLITISVASDQTLQLQVRDKDALSAPVNLGAVEASPSYQTAYFRGVNHDYLAVLPSASAQLSLSRDIFTNRSNLVTSVVGKNTSRFTINRSGRYLILDESDRMVSIDLENYQRARWQASLIDLHNWEWINDQHLVFEAGGQLRIIDFDGQNNQLIADNLLPGTPLVFGDNKSLLGLAQSTSGTPPLTHFFLNPDKVLE